MQLNFKYQSRASMSLSLAISIRKCPHLPLSHPTLPHPILHLIPCAKASFIADQFDTQYPCLLKYQSSVCLCLRMTAIYQKISSPLPHPTLKHPTISQLIYLRQSFLHSRPIRHSPCSLKHQPWVGLSLSLPIIHE